MKKSVSISVGTDFFVCKGDTNFCKIVTMTVLNCYEVFMILNTIVNYPPLNFEEI